MKGWMRRALPWFCLPVLGLFSACVFDTKSVPEGTPGYVSLELRLKPNASALLKSAASDTIFRLDSLIIELSSSGQSTITNRYSISGRADTGNIAVTAKTFAVAPLRTWKARIWTIDTTYGVAAPDTVHRDSVTFTVNPGDTTFVSKTVNPVYSILRARFVSNNAASITNPVKLVRIRVDGVIRDSLPIGKNLHGVSFWSGSGSAGNMGVAVGDSGILLSTSNGGANWTQVVLSTVTANLRSVEWGTSSVVWAVGDAGAIATSSTTGASFTKVATGYTQNLRAVSFTGASTGWIVGENGLIIKVTNGPAFTTQVPSPAVTANLNGVWFTSNSNGVAVGDGGEILHTTNGGSNWTAITVTGVTQNLNNVYFQSSSTGYIVGDGGVILKTTNSGAAWTQLNSNTTRNLTGIAFTTSNNGIAVGDSGTIVTTTTGGNTSPTWTVRASGTKRGWDAVAWAGGDGSGVAVGDYSLMAYSTDMATFTLRPFGSKTLDFTLAYKYFTPNVSHTLLMDAIDTLQGSLRGYQTSKTILLAPGKDTTITPNSSLTQCGYGGSTPSCQ